MESFRKLLESSEEITLDGAMGTELERRGVPERCEANIGHPDAVLSVHRDYLAAGSDAILTNTLTMNRIFIETHRLSVDVREVNIEGARIARQAAAGRAFVLGNLSSTGEMLEPYGSCTEQQATEAFGEQARYLLEGGVDGFVIETIIDLREAVCAVRACKGVSDLPVIASLAFGTTQNGGRTVMGNSARDCASRLSDEGADAVGANCGSLDPEEMAQIVSMLKPHSRVPVLVEPNAGKPRLVAGVTVYTMEPHDFAHGILRCLQAGARILGGCCGTTPAHIAALRELRKGKGVAP